MVEICLTANSAGVKSLFDDSPLGSSASFCGMRIATAAWEVMLAGYKSTECLDIVFRHTAV